MERLFVIEIWIKYQTNFSYLIIRFSLICSVPCVFHSFAINRCQIGIQFASHSLSHHDGREKLIICSLRNYAGHIKCHLKIMITLGCSGLGMDDSSNILWASLENISPHCISHCYQPKRKKKNCKFSLFPFDGIRKKYQLIGMQEFNDSETFGEIKRFGCREGNNNNKKLRVSNAQQLSNESIFAYKCFSLSLHIYIC